MKRTDFVYGSHDFIYMLNGESKFAEAPPQVLLGGMKKMKLEQSLVSFLFSCVGADSATIQPFIAKEIIVAMFINPIL